ncbi:MAG: rod shape-determining protein MreD [Gemmatimonadetes bacterium]|nr:rod shape-determining protein MreD [Gemmatimonadota bacterium]
MIIARNILLILLALLLQASWIESLAIYGVAPDIVIIILIFIAFTRGQIEATLLGFISGLLIDIYDPGTRLGVNALGNSLIGFFAGYSRVGIAAEALQAQALILFLATLLHDIIFFLVALQPLKILSIGLGTSLYTATLGTALSSVLTHFSLLNIQPHAE